MVVAYCLVGTNETFSVSSVDLHSEVDGHLSSDPSDYSYDWWTYGTSPISISKNGSEATYSYNGEDSDKKYVRASINPSPQGLSDEKEIINPNNFSIVQGS